MKIYLIALLAIFPATAFATTGAGSTTGVGAHDTQSDSDDDQKYDEIDTVPLITPADCTDFGPNDFEREGRCIAFGFHDGGAGTVGN